MDVNSNKKYGGGSYRVIKGYKESSVLHTKACATRKTTCQY